VKRLRIVNIVALIVMLVVNALASTTSLIGGTQTAAVSDATPTLFTPAGYVFSIWSLIYIGLIAFAVFQARNTPAAEVVRGKIGYWFAANALFNVLWLFLWGAGWFWPSVIVMLGLLGTLIIIYRVSGSAKISPAALMTPS
jgi:benzodiazapine receptor